MHKYRPGQLVWCLNDGAHNSDEPGKYRGTIVKYKRSGLDANTGEEIEEYVVAIPALGGTWLITTDYLEPRTEEIKDPPWDTDYAPNSKVPWAMCVWQPGDPFKGRGKIYVP